MNAHKVQNHCHKHKYFGEQNHTFTLIAKPKKCFTYTTSFVLDFKQVPGQCSEFCRKLGIIYTDRE